MLNSIEKELRRIRRKGKWRWRLFVLTYSLALMVTGYLVFTFVPFLRLEDYGKFIYESFSADILIFTGVGFCAGLVDGALGMAYGVTCTTFLMTWGVTPAVISASVHTSEIFTSGVSGLMHLKFKNVNHKLFKKLLLPGVLGSIAGAVLLYYFDAEFEKYKGYIRPVIALYCFSLGILIIAKVLQKGKSKKKVTWIAPLGAFGGFMDSVGGGGWGPIVSSTLIARGRNPLYTVGSVNLTEFFVSLASAVTLIGFIGISLWQVILGLIIGGTLAAPIAAITLRKIPTRAMMIGVGILVIILSIRIILLTFLK